MWEPKEWRDKNLQELTWCTYEMVRLYISSFAFQAHVQRAWMRAETSAAESNGEKTGGAGGQGQGAASGAAPTPSSALFSGNSGGERQRCHGGFGGATAPLMIGHSAGSVQLFPKGYVRTPRRARGCCTEDQARRRPQTRCTSTPQLTRQPRSWRFASDYLKTECYDTCRAGTSSTLSLAECLLSKRRTAVPRDAPISPGKCNHSTQLQGPSSHAARTRELVNRVSAALVLASPDREHPASGTARCSGF